MKERVLKFLSKYRFWGLYSLTLTVVGLCLSNFFADSYVVGDGMIQFNLPILYMLYVIPLFSLIYGIASYITLKKIWIQQLIMFTTPFVLYNVISLVTRDFSKEVILFALIVSMESVVCSLFGTLVTAFILDIVKSLKKHRKPNNTKQGSSISGE